MKNIAVITGLLISLFSFSQGNIEMMELEVTASADPADVCIGGPVQLSVTVSGGTGSYAYTWTSDPPGFSSTLRTPVVVPDTSTIYIVTANDGSSSGTDSVYVYVHDYPQISLGNDTTICSGNEIIIEAGTGFASYTWQDGSTGQSFTASSGGIYWVDVTNEWGCTTRDSLKLIVAGPPARPAKPAGPSYVDLYTSTSTTFSTTDFPGSVAYSWALVPEAGELDTNVNHVTIYWDEDFSGQCMLKVMATNMCGPGPWSDSLAITVVNTTGTDEHNGGLRINIFPNPGLGAFNISLKSSQVMTINMHIFDPHGKLVYRSGKLSVDRERIERPALENCSPGMYTLIIYHERGRSINKLVILE